MSDPSQRFPERYGNPVKCPVHGIASRHCEHGLGEFQCDSCTRSCEAWYQHQPMALRLRHVAEEAAAKAQHLRAAKEAEAAKRRENKVATFVTDAISTACVVSARGGFTAEIRADHLTEAEREAARRELESERNGFRFRPAADPDGRDWELSWGGARGEN